MRKILDALLGKAPAPAADEDVLALQRQVQQLRLDLAERERAAANLTAEVERQRQRERAAVDDAVRAKLERLVTDAAGPAAQLLTQAHLIEAEGKPVQARDVLAVARRLLRVLQDEGLTTEGEVGRAVPFDPARHEPIAAGEAPRPGREVIVRFVGVSHRGKVVRKAGVSGSKG